MIGWWASRRRLQARAEYLQLQLDEARKVKRLVVRPGPPPVPVESGDPDDLATILRAKIRVLEQMTTVPGSQELAKEADTWRERAARLDARLLQAQAEIESLARELCALQAPVAPIPEQTGPGW
ncbi:hypothetical protein ABZ605_08495 [Streptomyces sp. NPDC012765]|uniref:hypothetical protein n=1 Tax=Streptomyces sp. NPDC012765 TaxID=3155249 RepID=UPI0033C43D44